jgi:hypothetical protein
LETLKWPAGGKDPCSEGQGARHRVSQREQHTRQ